MRLAAKQIAGGATVPTGAILPYGGTTAPSGYVLANGAAISRTTFADLFAVYGTTYGAGDGSTTFNVPDLRGRFPLGKAAAGTGSTLGGTGGTLDHTHTVTTGTKTVAAIVVLTTTAAPAADTLTSSGANPAFLAVNYIVKT